MVHSNNLVSAQSYPPGEVLALLSPLQELEPGLYLLHSYDDGWAVLRWVIDDEEQEHVFVTDRESTLPSELLELFMPIGLRLTVDSKRVTYH